MKKAIIAILVIGMLGGAGYLLYPKKHGATSQPNQSVAQTADANKPGANTQSAGDQKQFTAENNANQADAGPAPDVSALVAQGDSLAASGKILEARNAYSDALMKIVKYNKEYDGRPALMESLKAKIKPLNQAIYFDSSRIFDGQETYAVQSGDNMTKIAAGHKVPYQFIAKINGIPAPYTARIGQKLKIVNGPFNVLVDLGDKRLYVLHGDYYFCDYEISVGMPGWPTPTGSFTVLDKMDATKSRLSWTNPVPPNELHYSDVDKDNFMLGTRWIKFDNNGHGIHGRSKQIDDQPLGEAVSHGCVRMRNTDVEELYDMLVTHDSTVTIQE